MSTRHLLSLADLTAAEILGLLQRGAELAKIQRTGGAVAPLRNMTLAMIFEKSSTRTRVSFEVGAHQLGGHGIMLSPRDMQMGRGESIEDTAKVLSRYVDGIMIRTFGHDKLLELARHSTVPVINGLTDFTHPCQILADLLTCRDEFGADALTNLTVAWIGDGNNMAHSWINAAGVLGFKLNLACPEGYDPDAGLMAAAGDSVTLFRDPKAAAAGADVVTTDVWTSMGQEEEAKKRLEAFKGFIVNTEVMAQANPEAIFLHCLPAHRGEEASAEVVDGPQSRIFDEAENRLHAQKAVMEWLMGGRPLP